MSEETVSEVELAALNDPVVREAVAEAKTGDRAMLRRRPASREEEEEDKKGKG